ncbi:MAG: helix-turn-helix transcriptional regulator [Clostridiales bacterium]|nr:helix-turn-helix transcriptional regulator [Clostridiales bacterium]
MIDNIKVGKTIATLRQDRGMTQQQLAAALNVSHQAVSKWENGAALPDIQTMMELTRLFGITVEQLISGEIPADEPEERTVKTLDEHIQSFGKFVTNMVDGFRRPIHKSEDGLDEAPEYDGAEEPVHVPEEEAEETSDPSDAGEQKEFDVQKILKMAPFMSKSALDAILNENCDALSAEDIERLAPFVSKSTLDMLLLSNREKFTPDDIARLAPFLSKSTIEKLILNSEEGIEWDTLQKVAPFLKREMVDALAKAAAKGEKIVNRAFGKDEYVPTDFEKSIEDVSRKITKGVEKVARHAQKFGEWIVDDIAAAFSEPEEEKPRTSRSRALRLAAIERAMKDGRWDWIAEHLSDVQDENVRGHIAQTAMDHGMTEWLKTNLPEYAGINEAEKALENCDWEAVTGYIENMDAGYCSRAAMKAASERKWEWIAENADKLDFGENAMNIARLAYECDMKETAVTIAETRLTDEETEAFMDEAVEKGDHAFAAQLSHLVSSEHIEVICTQLGAAQKWATTSEYLPLIESEGIERLMELAISQGNFEAIDLLDDYLDLE